MKQNNLHLAIIFKASNLNYGEGVGNILSLKKLSSEGRNYSYISRQALRYDIVRMLEEIYGYPKGKVSMEKGNVIQFAKEATIDKFPEIDFFGYMKTSEMKIRKATLRLTDAISLEPYHNDTDFGTNKGLADRLENEKDKEKGNNIFQAEIHRSHYCYSLTCNLDEIGKDEKYDIELKTKDKAERIGALLNVIKLLYRDIRGKRENMSPLLAIGGLYESGNPFFYNRLKIEFSKSKISLDADMLNDILKIKAMEQSVKEQTSLGYTKGEFSNIEQIDIENKLDIEDFFQGLTKKVNSYYSV